MAPITRTSRPRASEPAAPRFNPNAPVAEQVLASAQSSRDVVQDFCPLAESLEWELGQQYLRERGNKAFISDASPVPFVINNDGTLSRHAAEVFLPTWSKQRRRPAGRQIFVLELGIGVGLFARYFLDNFRELCRKNHKDYYDRLCYIAADRSPRMLQDVLRMECWQSSGPLSGAAGGCHVRTIFSMTRCFTAGRASRSGRVLNYLLDCLPAAVLEMDDKEVRQLCVRTCVGRNVRLGDFTDMSLEMLRQRAKSQDDRAKQELLEVYGMFASEYDYRPVDVATCRMGRFAVEYAQRVSKRVLLSYGAIQCWRSCWSCSTSEG